MCTATVRSSWHRVRAHRASHLHEARVDEPPDDLVQIAAERGIHDVGEEVGVGVRDHDGKGDQHLALVDGKGRNARVEGDPQPVAAARGTSRPVAEIRLDTGRELTDAQEVEMPSNQLERKGEAVNETAQPIGGRRIHCRHGEARVDEARAIRQQRQCLIGWQRTDVDQRLVEHADAFAARDEHPDLRTGSKYSADLDRDLGAAPFTAVEDDQSHRVAKLLDHTVGCVERSR